MSILSIATRRAGLLSVKSSTIASSSVISRFASSTSTTNTPDAAQSSLTWKDFFQLRKQQRRINVVSSGFTALVGCNISWAYLSNMEIDPTQMIMGFDPLVVVSAGLMASGALGYLFGPLIGTQVFNLKNHKTLTDFGLKNKEFLEHIIKNRVDASSQSFSNPVPDYYGEKIGSMKEYRQWLRDCHSYARKAKEFL
ncbi:similar to Saccharomyces cerevisiae YKR065C PAM17 Constituent of the Translocase of the Inner Mitochondrial membrane (TIM23 complex) [Maudiozyma barnettii]|uniref:Presequence translocated-associated motor subunit PAM17 n=1 Tax=Maudiozyma barnettii TaxID=61262 RepID=A0A8H2VFH9_9SACH|nr:Pam17p [Kazachstania barnettii]CAB4254615.1 similar to Saccharomyces cerevisiae YKR065C PAM17 Constituent of the Translocase of the Inner Mitochondrial membrane (TIM23 complex) [Kazachstania barnettii]CAD1782657.1 similar to Saccharomyces cerevisiae YKR065C PAM17 Constituent of the Translocase of the Inner Mitochondrial membrane (TIM23 complex) [Kazachstania barnettii]